MTMTVRRLASATDLSHDVVFALHVNVGCGFVEHIDRAVVQQRPGKRKALALPAGEVRALSVQRGVQPSLTAQETRQAHAFQHVPQRRVVCVRPGHAEDFRPRCLGTDSC